MHLEWTSNESRCIANRTTSNHLGWNMMEDNVRKRMHMCVLLGHCAVQQKLTEHEMSTIIYIISIKK